MVPFHCSASLTLLLHWQCAFVVTLGFRGPCWTFLPFHHFLWLVSPGLCFCVCQSFYFPLGVGGICVPLALEIHFHFSNKCLSSASVNKPCQTLIFKEPQSSQIKTLISFGFFSGLCLKGFFEHLTDVACLLGCLILRLDLIVVDLHGARLQKLMFGPVCTVPTFIPAYRTCCWRSYMINSISTCSQQQR